MGWFVLNTIVFISIVSIVLGGNQQGKSQTRHLRSSISSVDSGSNFNAGINFNNSSDSGGSNSSCDSSGSFNSGCTGGSFDMVD